MWKAKLNEDLKKVVLDSDTKGAYYLNYIQGEDGIYLDKQHLLESGMNSFDLADIKFALEDQNYRRKPNIFISDNI